MSETDQPGIAAMASRIQKRPRTVTPPRNPRTQVAVEPATEIPISGSPNGVAVMDKPSKSETAPTGEEATSPPVSLPAIPATLVGTPQARARRTPAASVTPELVANAEATIQLSMRVRRTHDSRLKDLIYLFTKEGIKVSQVELLEMFLTELPDKPTDELRRRVADYRKLYPRQ